MRYLIVGLGNPGRQYEDTRHNTGFRVIDELAKRYDIKVNKLKHKALLGEGIISGKKTILVKPQTFMNNSGESVRPLMDFYKDSELFVILDDIDIEFPSIRIRKQGSAGTHNGLKSVIKHMGTKEFSRLKVSVGQCPENYDLVDWVLGKFSKTQKQELDNLISCAADAVENYIGEGIDTAMNKFNKRI